MRLKDLESIQLVPPNCGDTDPVTGEHNQNSVDFHCRVLDIIIHGLSGFVESFAAPWSLSALESMTDEELTQTYADFTTVKPYPDISRHGRELFLWRVVREYAKLGNVQSLKDLISYLLDDVDGTQYQIYIDDNMSNPNEFSVRIVVPDDTTGSAINVTEVVNRLKANVYELTRNTKHMKNDSFSIEYLTAETDTHIICAADIGFVTHCQL